MLFLPCVSFGTGLFYFKSPSWNSEEEKKRTSPIEQAAASFPQPRCSFDYVGEMGKRLAPNLLIQASSSLYLSRPQRADGRAHTHERTREARGSSELPNAGWNGTAICLGLQGAPYSPMSSK